MFEVATQAIYREMTKNQGNPHLSVGALLREARDRNRLSRADVAARADISPTALQSYEDGTRMPRVDVLARLAALYGVTPNEIMGIAAPATGPPAEAARTRLDTPAAALYWAMAEVQESLVRISREAARLASGAATSAGGGSGVDSMDGAHEQDLGDQLAAHDRAHPESRAG